MRKIALLLLLLSACYQQSTAQILNIERMRLQKDSAKTFMIKGTAGLNIFNRSADAENPVNLFGYNVMLNAIYTPGKHSYIFIGKSDFLQINENPFLNFGFVHSRVNFLRDEKLNYEVFSQYSYDNFRGLDPRIIFGGSARLRLIQTEKSDLTIGFGGFYENEVWQHPVSEQSVRAILLKSSNYIAYRTSLSSFVDLNMVHYYQVGYDRSIDNFRNRISSNININTKITEKFSLNNSLDLSYEDRPIVPITRFIFALNLGFSFDL
ncbi:MAG: DUF481 domain-containing protein [Cyclobacteriaceae bacterium]